MGSDKLKLLLSKNYGLEVGRDRLLDILRDNNLLVKRKRKPIGYAKAKGTRTDNLYQQSKASQTGEIVASDTTYLKIRSGHHYLTLAVDVYSRMIVGHKLGATLHANYTIEAVDIALRHKPYRMHHSDGGCQYTSYAFKEFLSQHNCKQSMTRVACPQDNAIVERINGILKYEYDLKKSFKNLQSLQEAAKQAIYLYNYERPHSSLNMNTPFEAHSKKQKLSTFFRA